MARTSAGRGSNGRAEPPAGQVTWGLPVSLPAAWLDPAKPAGDQGHQLIEQDPPTGGVYAVASGHRIIIGRRHNPA